MQINIPFNLGDAVTYQKAPSNSTIYGVVKAHGTNGHGGQSYVLYNDGFGCWVNNCDLKISVPSWDSLSEGMTILSKGTQTKYRVTRFNNGLLTLYNQISDTYSSVSISQAIEFYYIEEDKMATMIEKCKMILSEYGYKVTK